jgi:CHAT domain-containing protein/tetratricopeptide (TPR) repeat protein
MDTPTRHELPRNFLRSRPRAFLALAALLLLAGVVCAQGDAAAKRAAAEKLLAEGIAMRNERGERLSREASRAKLEQALALFRELGDRPNEGRALEHLGFIQYGLGNIDGALAYWDQAMPLLRAAGARADEAMILIGRGRIHEGKNDQKAVEHYRQALALLREAGERGGEAIALLRLGAVYTSSKSLEEALDCYTQALALFRTTGDRAGQSSALYSIGSIYDSLGENERALDAYREALSLARASGAPRFEAQALSALADTYLSSGDHQKALEHYRQALALARGEGDRRQEGEALLSIGVTYWKLNDWRASLEHMEQALRVMRVAGDAPNEIETLITIGWGHVERGELDAAVGHYEEAYRILTGLKTGNIDLGVSLIAGLAYVEDKRGNLDKAAANIEAALKLMEASRAKISNSALQASYFASVRDYYDYHVGLLMRLHRQQPDAGHDAKAFASSERARARSLIDLLADARVKLREGADPELRRREGALRRQLNDKALGQRRLLAGPHTPEQAAALAKEIDELTTELQQLEGQLRRTSARRAALTEPQPLTLKEIQAQALDPDTLLLEYSLAKNRSYLWAVTENSVTSYELPGRDEIEEAARQFYAALSSQPHGAATKGGRAIGEALRRRDEEATARLSQMLGARLSQMLLAPAATLLGKKRLAVVADGALQFIPFAALPLPGRGPQAPPVISEHEVVMLPSASTLAVLRRDAGARRPPTKVLAVLADPVFDATDARLTARASRAPHAGADAALTRPPGAAARAAGDRPAYGSSAMRAAVESGAADAGGGHIPRLPGTRREAEEIVKLAPPGRAKKSLDFAASRAAATDPGLADYRYVHFATHGFLNSRHPELSGLMLSMFDERGRPVDGFMRLHEVFNLKLNADLVVLSACQTGLGKEVKGEGLVGLTRGFMYAGAPRVVVSLWSVSDEATAELMARFYRGVLAGGLRPAAALRAAQLPMLKDGRYSAPFYWAAFTLQGEWR